MPETPHQDLKAKVREEMIEYVTVSSYLLLVLGAFTVYRRLISAEYGVSQLKLGFALIEALILGKVVLIGQAMGVGRWLEHRALAWSALYKSLAFSVLMAILSLAERSIEAEFRHESPFQAMLIRGVPARDEALARSLMMFVAFVPFFALTELQGRYRLPSLGKLFFGEQPPRAD